MEVTPLVIIAAIVGLIVGALFAMIPFNRQRDEFQYRIRDLDSKLKNNDRDLTDTRSQVQSLQAGLRTAESNHVNAQDQLKAAADEKQALGAKLDEHIGQLDATRASLAELNTQHADLNAQHASLSAQHASLSAQHASLSAQHASLNAQHADLQASHDRANATLADLHTELEGKTAELETQRGNLDAAHQALAAREHELEKTKFDLDVANSMNTDFQSRLQRVRADIAAELALLTTTAIKLKDDALSVSNSRVDALTHEMQVLKSRTGVNEDGNQSN